MLLQILRKHTYLYIYVNTGSLELILCVNIMSDTRLVNTALQEYFLSLSGQIAAANRLKDAVTELLEERDEAAKSGKGNLDEWDVLDQSYICIKLRNAFAEIDTKLEAFKKNVSTACKQKDKHQNYVKNPQSTSEEVRLCSLVCYWF